MVAVRPSLMYSMRSDIGAPDLWMVQMAAQTAAPRSSKIMDTVVEVGRPSELKRFGSSTSAIITAEKIAMISSMLKRSGKNMPLRAISIMPEELVAPAITPTEATRTTNP